MIIIQWFLVFFFVFVIESPLKTLESPQQHSTPNKAHIVKPHMVNGHVLYRPTINLTRVSDVPLRSQRAVTPNNEV